MNDEQRQRWAKTRQWGPVRFFLFSVLAWGVPMGLMCPALIYGIHLWVENTQPSYTQPESYRNLVSLLMPITLLGGFLFGVTVWRLAEREFKNEPTESPWDSPLRWAVCVGLLCAVATMIASLAAVFVLQVPFQTKDGSGAMPFAQFAVPTAGLVGAIGGYVVGRRRHLPLYSSDKTKIPAELS